MNTLMRMIQSSNAMFDMGSKLHLGYGKTSLVHMQLSTESLDRLSDSPYQSEIAFNKLLPYADKLEEEADKLFAYIKANLGRCVMLRDINPGCIYWSEMLTKYILLYGLRFTKEEHVTLVKLMYELIIIPNLDSTQMVTFSSILIILLKKRELLTPDDLELSWKPLFNFCIKNVFSNKFTTRRDDPALHATLEKLIPMISPYFPPSATQEILDELMPQLCPLGVPSANQIIKNLSHLPISESSCGAISSFIFLPVELHPKYHSIGHELWLHEFMKIWEVYHNKPVWGYEMMNLIVRLAWNNIGYIDWNPYIPIMFTNFFRVLKLPCSYKNISHVSHYYIEVKSMSQWIVSVLGNNSCAQSYLDKLMKSVENYFHPANQGRWLTMLQELVLKLCYFFVKRLRRERYAEPTWLTPILDSHKLTEADIDAFVDSMLPSAMIAVFNSRCTAKMFNVIKHLAILRPTKVITSLLDKFSFTVGAGVEEHKVIFAMNSMTAISRVLVQGPHYFNKDHAFVEGPSHALSVLFSTLPNIDPNDTPKSLHTFELIIALVNQIPLVDCSQSRAEKSEDEHIICEETSRFEDFVLQLMDKIFMFISSSAVEIVRLENQSNKTYNSFMENAVELALNMMFKSVLRQTSDAIFGSALNKLLHFVEDSSLETHVAGKLVSNLCSAFSRFNPRATTRVFVPYLTEKILDAIGDGDDVVKEENLDNRLLYHLLLLEHTLSTTGDALLPYMDDIVKVLDKTIRFKSLEGQQLTTDILESVLDSLCNVNVHKLERNLDDPNYPYWTEWGKSVEIDAAQIKWRGPGEQEIAIIEMLFKRYFLPAVDQVQNYIKENKSTPQLRDELQRNLRVIHKVLSGGLAVFPYWSEQPLVSERYQSCMAEFTANVGNKFEINMPDRTNVRQFLVRLMTSLQEMILQSVEDDIKSLKLVTSIFGEILMHEPSISRIGEEYAVLKVMKNHFENELIGDKGYVPNILLDRVEIQHMLRRAHHFHPFTETSKSIALNLFKLSISQYSEIRSIAQTALLNMIKDYPNAYQILVDEIVEVFGRDTDAHHDAYKGALYLLNKIGKTLTKTGDWEILTKILPAFVLSKPSEKLSVIKEQSKFVQLLINSFSTINIKLEVPDTCVSAAAKLWGCGITPTSSIPTDEEIQSGIESLRKRGEKNLELYYLTLDKLLFAILEKNLHWRHRQSAMSFIVDLIHPDHPVPTLAVRYFLHALISESIDERKLAWSSVPGIMYQLKREHPKVQIEIPTDKYTGWKPGPRPDNAWLQYSREKLPKTAKEWDQPRYLHKAHIGYYAWPKKLEIYAPSSQQPNLDKNTRQLNDSEKEIDRFFSDQRNVDKLIAFNTLEEKKGRDSFNISRYFIFKGLFTNHGDAHLVNFLPHLQRMVQDKQESVQRGAAEIICGLVRGSKHWTFEMTENLWKNLLPIIRTALSNMIDETMIDWHTCFYLIFKNRDPMRLHWLIECLVEESQLAQTEVSFVECARLQILSGAISQQTWRLGELLSRLMNKLESRLLDCPYDNIRDRLASLLVTIFNVNMKFDKKLQSNLYPEISDFVDKLYPRLEPLLTMEDRKSEEYVKALRLLKTVCTWIQRSVDNSHFGAIPSFYRLYPLISQLETEEQNEELAATCSQTVATLAHAFILSDYMPFALKTLDTCSKSPSWSVRAGSLHFLKVLIFLNMSTLLSDKAWIAEIRAILMRSIKDERVEVRETAGQVLCGMVHCALIEDSETLLDEFKKLAETNLRSKKTEVPRSNVDAVRLRHAGVLGMCAFIAAHPYSVPSIVTPIFKLLNAHLTDPEPIPTTIRKTLTDFKRTHCDGWTDQQGLAESLTEEQITLLQDLTLPPSHYA